MAMASTPVQEIIDVSMSLGSLSLACNLHRSCKCDKTHLKKNVTSIYKLNTQIKLGCRQLQ